MELAVPVVHYFQQPSNLKPIQNRLHCSFVAQLSYYHLQSSLSWGGLAVDSSLETFLLLFLSRFIRADSLPLMQLGHNKIHVSSP